MIDVKSYKDDGYLLAKRVLSARGDRGIRDEAKQIFVAQMRRLGIVGDDDVSEDVFERGMAELFDADLQTFTNCGKQAQHLISLHRLSLDERVVRAIVDLGLEFPNVSTRPVLYFNSRRLAKKEVYWRLSCTRTGAACRARSIDRRLGALIDIDRSLGALEIIPGSS